MKQVVKYIILILILMLAGHKQGITQDTYQVENLSFNSRIFDDFAPMFYGDGIIFCSNRKTKIISNYTTTDNEPLLDLYLVNRIDSIDWGKPKVMSGDLASIFNEGPSCFSKDGNTIYYTRNLDITRRTRRNSIANNYSGIFIARFNGSSWGNITPFEHNVTGYTVAHPSLSDNGKRLFFASDMPGGFGKSDLYVCSWENGQWSSPVNLGPSVNSSGSELYPFHHRSGRLYYSSDRPGSSGGLDIYFTQEIDGNWVTPTHLSPPFNSPSDDFSFIADELIESGFFSSNRDRNDDIFSFTSLIPKYAGCDTLQENNYCFMFFEAGSYDLDTLPFIYEWDMDDGTKIRGLEAVHCFDGPGEYLIKLNVIDTLTKEIQYNEATRALEITNIEQPYITSVDTSFAGESITFDALNTNLPGFTIAEYFWNFDEGNIASGAEVRNIFASPGIYNIQLVIKSIPDNQGNEREACVSKQVVILEKPPG